MSTVPPEIAASILPPNARTPERAIEAAMRAEIDLSAVGTLWNPATCPVEVLPFLAWGLAISHWNPDWSEAEKRSAVADAIPYHQRKGTRAAVEEILSRFNDLLRIVEWWETSPRRDPHTFEVRAPASIPPEFFSEGTVEAIIRDVAAAKPLRSHFSFVQELEAQAQIWIGAAGLPGSMLREEFTEFLDESLPWRDILQTEDGEPIFSEEGPALETTL